MNEINIEWQQRTELLLGKDKMKRLRQKIKSRKGNHPGGIFHRRCPLWIF